MEKNQKKQIPEHCKGCLFQDECDIIFQTTDCPCTTCLVKIMCKVDCEKVINTFPLRPNNK